MNSRFNHEEIESIVKASLSKLEETSKTDLAPYFLLGNPLPFASVAIAETAGNYPPLRQEQLEEISRFLRTTLETGHFAGLKVVGDYGFGKTHLLRWLERQINSAGQGRILALYVQNPGTTPREFVARFTAAIGLEELKKRVWVPIAQSLRDRYATEGQQFLRELQTAKKGSSPQATLFDDPPSVAFGPELFDSRQQSLTNLGLNPERLREFSLSVLSVSLGNYELARFLVEIALSPESSAFRAWTAITNIDSPRSGLVAYDEQFKAILRLLKATGVDRAYLLFDELEDITSARLSKRAQAEYQAVLKMLIDQNLSEFALVVAVTENGLKEMVSIYPPLSDRLTHTVALRPLSNQDAAELIRRYLASARTETRREQLSDDLFPFAEDGISSILATNRRNPRAFLGFCHRLVAWGSSQGIKKLDAGAVEAFVQQTGGRL